MIDLELIIKGEELKKKLNLRNGVDGKDGIPGKDAPPVDEVALADRAAKTLEEKLSAFGTSFRDGLELLQGDERLDKSAIKGLDSFEKDIKAVRNRPIPVGMTQLAADMRYVYLGGVSKTLTYNGDGTLNTVTDSSGTKTMGYTSGTLTSVTGTGAYRNKSLHYTGGILDVITVS